MRPVQYSFRHTSWPADYTLSILLSVTKRAFLKKLIPALVEPLLEGYNPLTAPMKLIIRFLPI